MSSKVDAKFKYTKTHEWIQPLSESEIRLGISDHAQQSLGDVTYFELPEVGKSYSKGDTLGFVESVKAVSDIFSPVDMEITRVNSALSQTPEVVNSSPYQNGWYAEGKLKNSAQLKDLMDAKTYEAYMAAEES